jgi:glycosyltransferase involved in cell wall biosynthesis
MSSKKIRILYTIPNFDTAGSGKVVYDLAKHLDRNRFEVHIACKHDRGTFFKTVKALGLPIHFIDATVSVRPYLSLLKRLSPFKTFLKTHRFDVVHSWHWSSDWSEPLACRLSGIPFVYTKKAMSWGNIHWKLRSFLSHFIITVNSDMAAFFTYKRQQRFIPFGLDLAYYQPKHFPAFKEDEVFKIITVANLVPVKQIEVLIQAIGLLPHLPLQLEILGDDSTAYAKTLKQQVATHDMESKVFFLGKQPDVGPFLAKADLYVICSKQEGMPMALVEAMAMGLPVLGSNVSGIKDVLKDFPNLLFPDSDSKALSFKIEEIFNGSLKERQLLGEALRTYCETHFSMEAFIAAHEHLYLELTK